jgi:hypothetical protein
MSPRLGPHLGLVAHLEPNTHQIPHSLDHTPRAPPIFQFRSPYLHIGG